VAEQAAGEQHAPIAQALGVLVVEEGIATQLPAGHRLRGRLVDDLAHAAGLAVGEFLSGKDSLVPCALTCARGRLGVSSHPFPMNALRATLLMLVAAWSAAAGGLAGALHICQMAEARTACVCSHAPESQQAEENRLRRAGCCELQVSFAAAVPALSESGRLAGMLAAPALAPAFASQLPPPLAQAPRAFYGPAPPSSGPPVFLKVRSLLI
jgi:hypothetical protein